MDVDGYFIYVGRLDELKGIRIMFEAWKHMGISAPKLLVCGTGALEGWCKEFVQDNPDCNIELKGFVANIEAKKLIANAKALILPTQCYEGFPMTIVEAYSVGTPVVGSDIGNVGSLIQDGITGFKVRIDSLQEMVEAVKQITISPFRVSKIEAEKYSSKNNIEILNAIYTSVLSSSI